MSETPAAAPESPKRGFRHVRLVVALAVASLLGTFAVYTAFADSSIPVLMVSQANAYDGKKIRLEGKVTQSAGDAADPSGLRFTVKDYKGTQTLPVVYTGIALLALGAVLHLLDRIAQPKRPREGQA